MRQSKNHVPIGPIVTMLIGLGIAGALLKSGAIQALSEIAGRWSLAIGIFSVGVSVATSWFVRSDTRRFRAFRRTSQPPVRSAWFAASDLIPGPRLRKRVRKMLADQEARIDALRGDNRIWASRWIRFCTWLLFLFMVLKAPVAAVGDMLSRRRSA